MEIVPNELTTAINERLDYALKEYPDATIIDRDILYRQLLEYFDEYGIIPDFTITNIKKEEGEK